MLSLLNGMLQDKKHKVLEREAPVFSSLLASDPGSTAA